MALGLLATAPLRRRSRADLPSRPPLSLQAEELEGYAAGEENKIADAIEQIADSGAKVSKP